MRSQNSHSPQAAACLSTSVLSARPTEPASSGAGEARWRGWRAPDHASLPHSPPRALHSPGLWGKFLEPLLLTSQAQSSAGWLARSSGELLAWCNSAKHRVLFVGLAASPGGPSDPSHRLCLQPDHSLKLYSESRKKREESPSIQAAGI